MVPKFADNDRVTLAVDDAGVAQLRLARADKLNALDNAMFDRLIEAGRALYEMKGLRAVVLAGEGRGFCAGLDLAHFASGPDPHAPELSERTYGNANRFQQAAMQWRKLPVPVIAAIHGVCFGGGLQIACGADIRVVAPDARLAIMELKWGIVPDMGGFALWRTLVRDDVLRELVYSNREFGGGEAQALGFATIVDADPLARATLIARAIAERSPQAIRAAKVLANRAADLTADEILVAESHAQHALLWSKNQREAVTSQMQGRPPQFDDP